MVVLKYTQVNKDTLDNLVFTKDDRDNIVVNYRDANNTFKNESLSKTNLLLIQLSLNKKNILCKIIDRQSEVTHQLC